MDENQDTEGKSIGNGTVIHGDCIEELQNLDRNSVETVVTDPPYGLAFMGKEWDDFEPKEYQEFCEEWGEAVLRVLKPGGFLLAFSGTRTYHRMVCGLQNTGFEIRDMIAWMYGNGFPKGYNFSRFNDEWGGWSTTLKPAHEPVVVAQKPREGTYQENVKRHGVGGLNIGACRIGGGKGESRNGERTAEKRYTENGSTNIAAKPGPRGGSSNGRWPANVILDPIAATQLDRQTGELSSGILKPEHEATSNPAKNCYGEYKRSITSDTYGDSGGASRFFYSAKAATSERNAGLDDENDIATLKPINLMRYLVRLVTPPEGTVLDPFAGSGTTGCACEVESFDYVLIEKRERFVNEIISQRLEYWSDPENWGDLKDHNALPDPSTAESEESSADAMDESTLDQFVEGES
ncbi:DNA-methyltransferase [Haloterrigena salina]|uniref:DNA-methyltransferase n=1 Tax=Haloterrigena salina TaxID=504937 RepID=UPI0009FD3117|nr:site-specific DNA-methyltransferase [Haloterrigena salina]